MGKTRIGWHFTHNDADAVGCALVAALAIEDADFTDAGTTVFNGIGKADEVIETMIAECVQNWDKAIIPSFIVISDISISEKTCELLNDFVLGAYQRRGIRIELLGVDHHPTNHLDDKYEWWTVKTEEYDKQFDANLKVSAAYLLFEAWANYDAGEGKLLTEAKNNGLVTVINMISRYDTWEWKNHPYTNNDTMVEWFPEDIIPVYCKFVGPEKCFNMLLQHYVDNDGSPATYIPDAMHDYYNEIQDKRDAVLAKVDDNVRFEIENDRVLAMIINENEFSNDICEYINTKYTFVDIVKVIYPTSHTLGFRTKKTNIDLGLYAQRMYNGGGHPQASGARNLTDDEMLEELRRYYNGDTVIKIIYRYTNNTMSHISSKVKAFPVITEWATENISILTAKQVTSN